MALSEIKTATASLNQNQIMFINRYVCWSCLRISTVLFYIFVQKLCFDLKFMILV